MRERSLRARVTVVAVVLLSTIAVSMSSASAASAFSESYGFYEVGNNGYVQSAGAHTFYWNSGAGSNDGRLACQLFQKEGSVNEVEHGNGGCTVLYFGGAYVWARVYNESGVSEVIGGEAET